MGNVLKELKPAPLWKHFEDLCSIPHPSGHERNVASHVVGLAKTLGLESEMDEACNVVVRKPATRGMENRRTVVLQAHLDMVPQKNPDVRHDFQTDPIRPKIDGSVVRAQGTTLGADNGIGVATALAVLEAKNLVHGPVEALFTISEEIGLVGAGKLKAGFLRGDILLNLDNEEEGEFCIGCSGALDVIGRLPYREEAAPKDSVAFRVSVEGLKGGHSAVDIHLGRANANKILNRILWVARGAVDFRIANWEGGDLRNAIPRWAKVTFTMSGAGAESFKTKMDSLVQDLKSEFRTADPGLAVRIEKIDLPSRVMDGGSTSRLLDVLCVSPHGPFAMLRDLPMVTETSTNMAIVKTEKGFVTVWNLLRSSVDTKKTEVADMIVSAFRLAGGEAELKGGYLAWQPDTTSPVLKLMKDVYRKKFGRDPIVTASHGGLECGIIRAHYPSMDAVSFGPTIRYPHSPDEHVEIESVQKFWDFLVEVLKEVPPKRSEG